MNKSQHFRLSVGLLTGIILIQFVSVYLWQESLESILTGRQFVYLWAIVFGLIGFLLLREINLDRLNFALASIVVPWLIIITLVFFFRYLGAAHIEYMILDASDYFAYSGSFGVVGVSAVAVDIGIERFSESTDLW